MASVLRYIGSVTPYCDKTNPIPSGIPSWDGNKAFCENLCLMPAEDQLRCCLDQLLAISYYTVFYGRGCHELVNEFIDEFLTDLRGRVYTICERKFRNGPYAKVFDTIKLLDKFVRTYKWDFNIDVNLVHDFLCNVPYTATPSAWVRGMTPCNIGYSTFIIFMNANKAIGPQEVQSPQTGLTYFNLTCGPEPNTYVLGVCNYPIGVSFSSKETPFDKDTNNALLSYLSHFNMSDICFETVIGAIGQACLHLDVCRPEVNASQRLAACVMASVFGIGDINGTVIGFKPFVYVNDKAAMFDTLKRFLEFANKAYGCKARSAHVISKLFSCFAETDQQLSAVDFIRQHGGSASADQLQSSQECLGACIEALTFISQRPSLLSAQSQVAGPKAAENAEDKPEPKTETKPEEASKPKEETEPEKAEDKQSTAADDDDTSQDLGEDDTSESGGEDDKGDSTKSEDKDEGESSKPSTDKPAESAPAEEPEVNTSDEVGFEFKSVSAETETIDSVMFKEEMTCFLKNVLANPPDGLSPQSLATLTALQRYWLHSLSIETIMGIVGSCLKQLPKSLIQLNTKLYGVKRQ